MASGGMTWGSALVEGERIEETFPQAAQQAVAQLQGMEPDLAVIFATAEKPTGHATLPNLVAEQLAPRHWIGCSAMGLIGNGLEVEQQSGVSVVVAHLPDVERHPFHLENSDLTELGQHPEVWPDRLGLSGKDNPLFLLLADPFSFAVEFCLNGLDHAFPGSPVIGGLASGGMRPGANLLWVDGRPHHSGLVGLGLTGDIRMETLVAQGCRPIGPPLFVTRSESNVLLEVDGQRPDETLQQLAQTLSDHDLALFQNALFLGLAMEPSQQEYKAGDFLIRNLLELDPETGGISVGATLDRFQVVQFHVRDAHASRLDLQNLLKRYRDRQGAPPRGALLFSCLGRGQTLFGRPNHDSELFRDALGQIPLGGFFCNGEIGPVHGKTHLHGYTSSFGLFRPKSV